MLALFCKKHLLFAGGKTYYSCDDQLPSRSACPLTCHDVMKEGTVACVTPLNKTCQPGCFCPAGFVEINTTSKCVHTDDCPCFHSGVVSF